MGHGKYFGETFLFLQRERERERERERGDTSQKRHSPVRFEKFVLEKFIQLIHRLSSTIEIELETY